MKLALVLPALLFCSLAFSAKDPPGIINYGAVSTDLYAKDALVTNGVVYGMTVSDVKEVLLHTSVCGQRYALVPFDSPDSSIHFLAKGSFYALRRISDNDTAARGILVFCEDKLVEWHWLTSAFGWDSSWRYLPKDPNVLAACQRAQGSKELANADTYSSLLARLRNWLAEPHKANEVRPFLEVLFAGQPKASWAVEDGNLKYHSFREGLFPHRTDVYCAVDELGLPDEILAVRVNKRLISAGKEQALGWCADDKDKSESFQWALDLVASVYIKQGRVIATIFREDGLSGMRSDTRSIQKKYPLLDVDRWRLEVLIPVSNPPGR